MPQEVYETTMFKRARGLCEAGLPGCQRTLLTSIIGSVDSVAMTRL